MFECYLNVSATHRKLLEAPSGERYGDPTYSDPKLIKCRKELVAQEVQRTDGTLAYAKSLYTTSVGVAVGDLIDGHRVVAVDAPSLLGGKIPLYWSYTE